MSSLTKEELRAALLSHGVKLPPLSAKKEELVRLYEEHITPSDSAAGDFSSDDEEVAFKDNLKSPSKSNTSKTLLMSETLSAEDISKLEDDALFLKLKENGVEAGPIVSSTRPFYEKKLAAVLFGPVESAESSKEFSDTEPEDEEEEDDQPSGVTEQVVPERRVTRSGTTSPPSPSKSPKSPGLRQRMAGLRDELDSSMSGLSSRASIHSYKVTEVKRQTVTRSRDGKETRDVHHTIERTESDGDSPDAKPAKKSSFLSSLCKLLLLVIVLVVAYLLYTSEVAPGGVIPADTLLDAINSAVPQAEEGPLPPVERDPAPDQGSLADV